MTFRVGGTQFQNAAYDESGDVLYLSTNIVASSVMTYGTAEGHAVRIDEDQQVVGITIVNARWLVQRHGEISITVPGHKLEMTAGDIGSVLEHSLHL